MLTLISVEGIKLRRSLALALCVAAPAVVALMCVLFLVGKAKPSSWVYFMGEGIALWSYFMLPMSVTALTVLIAQLEHGPRMWNHLLALPVPRSHIFAAKTAVTILLTAAMMILLLVLLTAAGTVWNALVPARAMTGPIPLAGLAQSLAYSFAASLAMIVLQLWAALRFRSFVPPLVLGIMGTFGALAVTASREFYIFPWLLGAYAMQLATPHALTALAWGFLGGLILIPLMCADLARHERLVMG